MQLEVVELGKALKKTTFCSTTRKCRSQAWHICSAGCGTPEFPEPIGVFRCVDRPRYEERMDEQIAEAKAKRVGNLEALFNSGDHVVVE